MNMTALFIECKLTENWTRIYFLFDGNVWTFEIDYIAQVAQVMSLKEIYENPV